MIAAVYYLATLVCVLCPLALAIWRHSFWFALVLVMLPVANIYVGGISLVLCLAIVFLISNVRFSSLANAKWFFALWAFWLVWAMAGFATNGVTARQLFQTVEFVVYGFVAVTFVLLCRVDNRWLNLSLSALICSAVFLSVLAVVAGAQGGEWPALLSGRNELSFYVVVAGVLPVLYRLSGTTQLRQQSGNRMLYVLALMSFFLAFSSAESRGATACAAMLVVGYGVFMLCRKRMSYALLVFSLIAPVAIIAAVQLGALSGLFDLETNFSNLERLNLLLASWRLFLDKPLLGWGWGSVDSLIPAIGETVLSYPHPHSFLAHFSIELGLGGVLLFVLIVGRPVFRGINLLARGFRTEGLWCIAVSVVIIIMGAVDVIFYGASRALPTLFILALVEALPIRSRIVLNDVAAKVSN